MAKNICLDCIHFLACNKASEDKTECNEFIKVHRKIERKEEIKKC